MYIEDTDTVITLRNHRAKAIALRDAAKSSALGDFTIYGQAGSINVWSVISSDPVRSAIVAECDRFIAEKERELGELGVNVSQKLVKAK